MSALFSLGVATTTPGALELLAATGTDHVELLARHQGGDWGDVPPSDAKENRYSVRHGFRIISSYPVGEAKLWIITEADRSSTCILLPEDY